MAQSIGVDCLDLSATLRTMATEKIGNQALTDPVRLKMKHSTAIRWMHWVNFPIVALMIVSGVQIYWAHTAYTPDSWEVAFQILGLDHKLSIGMAIHFALMWLFAINGLMYVTFLFVSGEWRELVPRLHHFREAIQVTLHDLGFRKFLPPQNKFNAAQRIAYTSVIGLGVIALVSGVAIYKPIQLHTLTALLGGYSTARLIHFIVAIAFVGFFVTHIIQVIRAGWNNFQAMVTGFEVSNED